jgi:hypothetical protein
VHVVQEVIVRPELERLAEELADMLAPQQLLERIAGEDRAGREEDQR